MILTHLIFYEFFFGAGPVGGSGGGGTRPFRLLLGVGR